MVQRLVFCREIIYNINRCLSQNEFNCYESSANFRNEEKNERENKL